LEFQTDEKTGVTGVTVCLRWIASTGEHQHGTRKSEGEKGFGHPNRIVIHKGYSRDESGTDVIDRQAIAIDRQ
jgi:hypothetical protein